MLMLIVVFVVPLVLLIHCDVTRPQRSSNATQRPNKGMQRGLIDVFLVVIVIFLFGINFSNFLVDADCCLYTSSCLIIDTLRRRALLQRQQRDTTPQQRYVQRAYCCVCNCQFYIYISYLFFELFFDIDCCLSLSSCLIHTLRRRASQQKQQQRDATPEQRYVERAYCSVCCFCIDN